MIGQKVTVVNPYIDGSFDATIVAQTPFVTTVKVDISNKLITFFTRDSNPMVGDSDNPHLRAFPLPG